MKSNKIVYTIDVEADLHGGRYNGIREGLVRFEKLCDKYNIKPTLFVVASCVKENQVLFKRWNRKGWDISLHGFSHKRFDDMTYGEKEDEIKKSIEIFKKHIGIKPRGFRAPQHSIDRETLEILERYGFEYDSSYAPLNLLQLLFFPRRVGNWVKLFFSRLNRHKIGRKLEEVPTAALLVPFVSLTLRVFPKWLLRLFVWKIKLFYKNPVFYAHSWDFIELKESRIDRTFGHERFLDKLEYLMKNER